MEEGWREGKKCMKGVSDSQKEGEEREWSKLTGSNKTVSGTAGKKRVKQAWVNVSLLFVLCL